MASSFPSDHPVPTSNKHLVGSKWTRLLPPRHEHPEPDPSEDRRCHFVVASHHRDRDEVTMKGILGGADLRFSRTMLHDSTKWIAGWLSPSALRTESLKADP